MAAPEQWWVIWSVAASGLKYGQRQFHIVESPSKPKPTGTGAALTTVEGPYRSKKAAEAAVGSSTGTTGVGTNPAIGGAGLANQPPALPSNPLGAIGHWIGELVAHLTDAAMWRSIGWLALGILCIFTGVLLWIKQTSGSLPVPFPV